MKFLALSMALALLTVSPVPSDPDGFVYWSADDMGKLLSDLPNNVTGGRALETYGSWGNHRVMVVYRPGNGLAELHETDTDFYIVQSGEGTLLVGGEVVGGKTTAPGEIRGDSIRDGKRIRLGAGDVINIPSKTPHQVLVEQGKNITYLIVKVADP